VASLFFFRIRDVGWHAVDGSKIEWSEREALFEGQPPRQYIEVTDEAALKNSRARLWRYPPGTRGRRHADKVQEEVFVVVSGTLTMQLGEPPERVDVGAPGLIAVEPGTPLLVRNEGDEDLVLYIYGAPAEQGGADFFEDTGDL
jgi:mannose-6-phosphate isomerase-like protein (cupin superfamily)